MSALPDTNAFLWFISGNDRLSENARNYITDFNNEPSISIASLWEIAIKTSIGKLELFQPFEQFIPDQLKKNAIELLPIGLDHVSAIINLEFHHRDPFDRIIIAQGLTQRIPVITSDTTIEFYRQG